MHPLGVGESAWSEWGSAFLASNAVALAFLVFAVWRPMSARILFALGFIGASRVNVRTVLLEPLSFLDYAQWAAKPYRDFILGPFAAHPALFVVPIALGQLICGLMLLLGGGRLARVASAGAAVFLVAIAPLGFGSAFPATLLMAAAVVFIGATAPDAPPADLLQEWMDRHPAPVRGPKGV